MKPIPQFTEKFKNFEEIKKNKIFSEKIKHVEENLDQLKQIEIFNNEVRFKF